MLLLCPTFGRIGTPKARGRKFFQAGMVAKAIKGCEAFDCQRSISGETGRRPAHHSTACLEFVRFSPPKGSCAGITDCNLESKLALLHQNNSE